MACGLPHRGLKTSKLRPLRTHAPPHRPLPHLISKIIALKSLDALWTISKDVGRPPKSLPRRFEATEPIEDTPATLYALRTGNKARNSNSHAECKDEHGLPILRTVPREMGVVAASSETRHGHLDAPSTARPNSPYYGERFPLPLGIGLGWV